MLSVPQSSSISSVLQFCAVALRPFIFIVVFGGIAIVVNVVGTVGLSFLCLRDVHIKFRFQVFAAIFIQTTFFC
jgi:hypothetical protein